MFGKLRFCASSVRVGATLVIAAALMSGPCTSEARAFVYWIDRPPPLYQVPLIDRANLDGTGIVTNFIESNIDGLAIAVDSAHLYWTNNSSIGRANVDGSAIDSGFVAGASGAAVAVDGSRIYWTQPSAGRIGRANLDGTGGVDQNFISAPGGPFGVAVDDSHIYWANHFNGGSTIGRANLDGTGVDQSFITGASAPFGVAVNGTHVYWSNIDGRIGRANLNGSAVDQDFITGLNDPNGPCAIALDATHIYWTGSPSVSIGRANLDGTGVDKAFIAGSGVGCGIAVDALSLHPTNTTITSSKDSIIYGDGTLLFSASVTDGSPTPTMPTGNVQFAIDGIADGAPIMLVNGKAQYDSSWFVNVGATITARYSGDSTHAASSVDFAPVVQPAVTSVSLTSSQNPQVVGQRTSFLATVANLRTGITPFGSVQFLIGGTPVGTAPVDGNGQASAIGTPIATGDYVIRAIYHDDTGSPPDFTDSEASLTETIISGQPTTPSPLSSPAPPPLSSPAPPAQPPIVIHPAPAHTCVVPRLTGLRLAAAKTRIRRAHCALGKVRTKHAKRRQRETVLSTRPRAGTHLTSGHEISLTVGE